MNGKSTVPEFDLEELVVGSARKKEFRECLEKLGAFLITNHGIGEKLMEETDKVCRNVFGMPLEKKLQYAQSHANSFITYKSQISGNETISIPQNLGISYFCNTMWPEDSESSSREALEDYVHKMQNLSESIIKILLRNFGVEKYFETTFSQYWYRARLNYFYELKEETEEFIILPSHSDSGIMTILKIDDKVGGLQFLDEESGNWIDVPTTSSCIIVLLGDMFRAWSNGRTHNPKHRVIAKGPQQSRVTIAFFCHFPSDMEVYAPQELVDNAYPRCYKPFFFKDFSKAKLGIKLNNLGTEIDTFAALE